MREYSKGMRVCYILLLWDARCGHGADLWHATWLPYKEGYDALL